jgi:hypothetical protein
MLKRFIFFLLLLTNTFLFFWYLSEREDPEYIAGHSYARVNEADTLQSALLEILRSHKIEERNIRQRVVQPGIRTEVRVIAPRDISMTVLNFDIHRAVRALGYSVSAREDSRTGNVSIHIRDEQAVVLTVHIVRN